MIAAIVAADSNWGIGFNGNLLEHIPEDLKYFKQLTTDKVVVMGRKTWDSLPKKPLPNRTNIIITKDYKKISDQGVMFYPLQGIKNFMQLQKNYLDFFVIGGGQIYKELLPFCDRVYVTKIYKEHENVDTYFPNLDNDTAWASRPIGTLQDHKDFSYQFWEYVRIS